METTQGGFALTSSSEINMFRLLSLKYRLHLELKGMRSRGVSTFSIVKREFNLHGSRQSVFEQFSRIVESNKQPVTGVQ